MTDEQSEYAAKKAYQNSEQAQEYDAKRFRSWRGKMGHALDIKTLSKALKKLPHLPAQAKLLDIPCGTGRITRFLLELGYSVTAADMSREMMQVAETKVEPFANFKGFYQEDASHTSFDPNTFDCIISIRFIGHIPQPVRIQILKEFARLSPYAIIEYSVYTPTVTLRRWLEQFLKLGLRLPKRWPWHIFTHQELHQELAQGGFSVVDMWSKLPLLSDSFYVLVQRKEFDKPPSKPT